MPGGAASLAVDALGNGYAVGYVVCGVAALASGLLAAIALRGDRSNTQLTEAALAQDT